MKKKYFGPPGRGRPGHPRAGEIVLSFIGFRKYWQYVWLETPRGRLLMVNLGSEDEQS